MPIKAGDVVTRVGNTGVDIVERMILADQPWLGIPGVKQLWEGLFDWLAGYFIKAAANGANFVQIDLQVGGDKSDMSVALQNLVAAEKTGDPDAIRIAVQAYAKAQSNLGHINH